MFWFLAMGFAAYVLFFKAAAESWTRRWRGPGARAARCGMSGHEVARQLLEDAGLAGQITVGRGRSGETARFVAGKNKLLLGPEVHDSQTIGAVMLAALAVAEGLTEAAILGALAPLMDPVFLPRPLLLVERLPRNEVGKLPREQLLAAMRR